MAHLVWDNFIYRLEGTVSLTATTVVDKLRLIDRPRDDEPVTAPRSYSLRWLGSEPDDEPTDMHGRWAQHTFELEVYYPAGIAGLRDSDLQRCMLQDRHDILKVLRDSAHFAGTSDSAPAAATGLCDRNRDSDELDTDSDVYWVFRSVWMCLINEAEY